MNGRPRWLGPTALALALLPLAALFVLAQPGRVQDFPHEAHAGLFGDCASCHQGVVTGVSEEFYPDPATCATCHDGVRLPLVSFTVAARGASNLRFEHVRHARAVAPFEPEPLACATCHASPGASDMTVEPMQAARCLDCHARPGTEHLVGADCASCHVPLAEAGFPLERIAALTLPSDHTADGFLRETHGRLVVAEASRCATCHTRDLCVSCHVDATRAEMALLPVAPPGMRLPPVTARYPEPASHRAANFRVEHGGRLGAADAARCATCHTRDDCASCHLPPLPAAARALPLRAAVTAPGVGLDQAAPESHQVPRFERAHGTLAGADPGSCVTCHTQPFCVQCHSDPGPPVYHEPNFVARHAADGWARNSDCSSCHEVQRFCRDCHVQAGFGTQGASQGRLGPAFHDAEPIWLIRHAQPARQSLETCATCHTQRDCVQCHSDLGTFRVNPHGPGFDPVRARQRSPAVCAACHLGGAPGR